MSVRIRRSLFALVVLATSSVATSAQVVQQGTAAAGTLQLTNVNAAARDAMYAAIDANHHWAFSAAVENADKALAADSSFGLARVFRATVTAAPTVDRLDAEYRRGIADAAARPVPELTYALGLRASGTNANRLLATARAMMPNDRRVALDHALSFIGENRLDSLRSLAKQYPDFAAPRMWLAFFLTQGSYTVSPAAEYEALVNAQNAVRLAPNMAGTHMALGHVLQRSGRGEEALGHLAAATKLNPQAEYAYVLKSDIYMYDGKPQRVERARAALDSAISATVNADWKRDWRRDRAFLLFYDGKSADGVNELSALARELESAAPAAANLYYMQLAALAAGIGESANVERYIATARRVSPTTNVSAGAVHAYALNHQPAEARRELEEFVRRADTTTMLFRADLHRLTGMTLLAEGKPAEAIAELKKSDVNANTFVHFTLMEAYTALKNQKEADVSRNALLKRKAGNSAAVSLALANYRASKR